MQPFEDLDTGFGIQCISGVSVHGAVGYVDIMISV
jgi:hypothetical protein